MEHIGCICMMRELVRALSSLEATLIDVHGVSLNEAMAMCAIGSDSVTPSTVMEHTGLSASNVSKVMGSLERKRLVSRKMGREDKRHVMVCLTARGRETLQRMKDYRFDIPEVLRGIHGSDSMA
ncbi:MAG: MarR family winged helix-turn-helix transcriptional regulator [Prevotella sp.]